MNTSFQSSRFKPSYFLAVIVGILVSNIVAFTASADDKAVRTLGAYQTYKSPSALWLIVDVDTIVTRNAYSEPPSVEQNACVLVFRVEKNGTIDSWQFDRNLNRSASENFSVLVAVHGDVFVVFESDSTSFRFTKEGNPLSKFLPVSLEKLARGVGIDVSSEQVRGQLTAKSKEKLFLKTQSDVYGMGRSESDLPAELAKIQVRFLNHPSGWGAKKAIVESVDPEFKWMKTLVDMNVDQHQ